MHHSFEIEDAEKYGVLGAVILSNIKFWQTKNAANGSNFYEGRYWVYNSVKAWGLLFPYASADQIRRALEQLKEAGALLTGCFNSNAYDRTTWYSCQIDLAKTTNGFGKDAEPIPVVNTVINTSSSVEEVPYAEIVNAYHECLPDLPKVLKLTESRKKQIKSRWLDRKKAGRYTDLNTGITYWSKFFTKINESDLLMGRSGAWRANLEWIMKESNFLKIAEGAYK